MKYCVLSILLLFSSIIKAQDVNQYETPPVFKACENEAASGLQSCFDKKVYDLLFKTFQIPEKIKNDNYNGTMDILFEVNAKGEFHVIYVDAAYNELKEEAKRVFKTFPKVKPPTYNGNKTYKQFSVKLNVPLNEQPVKTTNNSSEQDLRALKSSKIKVVSVLSNIEKEAKKEFDKVQKGIVKYTNKAFKSSLNIPFTHSDYAKFDRSINMVGTNSHTAAKPFMYDDISQYYDFEAAKKELAKQADSWLERKLWNEHLVEVQSKNYWFTIDPIFDLQIGKDTDADFNTTYNNTRGVYIQGGLGKQLSFSTSVYESQGRFAEYYNDYAESLRGFGPDPAVIPGRGIAKRFKEDAYDYPVAEAYLSYSPAKFLNLQFGHGKQFIGDGYRSLFLSDAATPYPFLKLNTKFWKLKYTNTWQWLQDIRTDVVEDKSFLRKYIANHYLSWNVNKRLNVGLFESVIWRNTNGRGFDVNYLNPIIFYRAIEFATGQGAGNAIVGASAKYKYNDNINLYWQFVLDEFSLADIKAGEKSWKNKYGFQLGVKYFDAFKINNLILQAEYNQVRPYTYSHNTIVLNYAHNNQPLAHLWSANFKELVLIGRYNYKRWFGEAKLVAGLRGLDFDNETDTFSYGGDIYKNYNNRPFDTGVEIGQGIGVTTTNASIQVGYLINPAANLKLFTNINYRNFNPETIGASTLGGRSSSIWFNLGLRTDLFNWYFDL